MVFSIKFERIEEVYTRTQIQVDASLIFNYMTQDPYVEGHYLLAAGFAIYTTKDFQNFQLLAGNAISNGYKEGTGSVARFGVISGIIPSPRDDERLWIADNSNHCIRDLNRKTNKTSYVTGRCKNSDDNGGKFEVARLGKPVELVGRSNQPNEVYFYDNNVGKIKCLCFSDFSWYVITLSTLKKTVHSFVINLSLKILYMATKTNILVIQLGKWNKFKYLLSIDYAGYSDGFFNISKVNNPRHVTFITDNIMLVADHGNSAIRLVDLNQNKVTSVCTSPGVTGTDYENSISECKVMLPMHMAQSPSGFFITGKTSIYKLTLGGKQTYAYSCRNNSLMKQWELTLVFVLYSSN